MNYVTKITSLVRSITVVSVGLWIQNGPAKMAIEKRMTGIQKRRLFAELPNIVVFSFFS